MTTDYSKNPTAIAQLTPDEYAVTQESATEPAFTGKYWDNHEDGIYVDIVLGRAPVLLDRQVRQRIGLAELHQADRSRERDQARGQQLRDAPHGGPFDER